MAKKKYYVVWRGRQPGIYTSWAECKAQVHGFNDAQYKSFASKSLAEEAYASPYEAFKGKDMRKVRDLSAAEQARIGDPIPDSYAVDAACHSVSGRLEYQCVHVKTGRSIFHQGPFDAGTNNVGEFLALVHILALCEKNDDSRPIYSDSETAISWIRAKQCRTKLQPTSQNRPLFALIERADLWLANHDITNPIYKWVSHAWGEIPADFGRK